MPSKQGKRTNQQTLNAPSLIYYKSTLTNLITRRNFFPTNFLWIFFIPNFFIIFLTVPFLSMYVADHVT